jgi:hypothetical protein
MNFNFNDGGVKVSYQLSNGNVKEKIVYTRIEFNYISANYALVEANQTTQKSNI